MSVGKDGKPMVRASALGALTTPTASSAPTAAIAAAINPTATNQATVMRPATAPRPQAAQDDEAPVVPKPDPVKKAINDTLKKKAQEKKSPSEWSSEIVRKAVAGTEIQVGGKLYAPIQKTNSDQIIKSKPTPMPGKPADTRGQIISSYSSTVPTEMPGKIDLFKEAP
mmetsp:Transcript_30133/g.37240  ORF Transcript_30133/g.37240 Transcript_30133/m.37240 type:complete len:168 (-) Transcript_30133:460-963(-)